MNARLFPGNWRPLAQEAAFAARVGFDCLQLVAYDEGIDAARLGAPLDEAGATLREAGLGMVLEIVVRVDRDGRTAAGVTPFGALEACLPTIRALAVDRVHLHLAPTVLLSPAEVAGVEDGALDDLAAGVELAETVGFRLGLEHNEPRLGLFSDLTRVRGALAAVPQLGFVWDVNHAPPDALDELLELTPRLTLLHVSDCPLPELNAHFPLGEGSLPLTGYLRALLERGWRARRCSRSAATRASAASAATPTRRAGGVASPAARGARRRARARGVECGRGEALLPRRRGAARRLRRALRGT